MCLPAAYQESDCPTLPPEEREKCCQPRKIGMSLFLADSCRIADIWIIEGLGCAESHLYMDPERDY